MENSQQQQLVRICGEDGGDTIDENGLLEYSLLELQGSLLATDGEEDVPLDGLDLGTFYMKNGAPTLTIRSHQLPGKLVALPKPLLVLQRSDGSVSMSDDAADGADQSQHYTVRRAACCCRFESCRILSRHPRLLSAQVAGIVRAKYLFKTRPSILCAQP